MLATPATPSTARGNSLAAHPTPRATESPVAAAITSTSNPPGVSPSSSDSSIHSDSSSDNVNAQTSFGIEDSDGNIVLNYPQGRQQRPEIKAATLLKLVERITFDKYSDPVFLRQFLLTFHSFTDPLTLLELLRERFFWIPEDKPEDFIPTKQNVIRLHVLSVFKAWVQNHFTESFADNPLLSDQLKNILEEMGNVPECTKLSSIILKDLEKKRNERSPSIGSFTLSPSLTKIASTPNKRINHVLDIPPETLAEQITLFEHELFRQIQPTEFLGLCWAKRRKEAPNIMRLINWSNRMIRWLSTIIVTEPTLKKRVAICRLAIDTAAYCKKLHNFNAIVEIMGGLNSHPSYRLRKTWSAIGKPYEAKLADLAALTSSDRNSAVLREYIASVPPPTLPYLGLFLTDLTFIEDGIPDLTFDGLINFDKRRFVATMIEKVILYQNDHYTIPKDPSVQEFVKTATVLTETELYAQSQSREKKINGELVVIEGGDVSGCLDSEEEDFGEMEVIPNYPFVKDAPGKNIIFEGDTSDKLIGATLPKLVERATPSSSNAASDQVAALLFTFPLFTTAEKLIDLLNLRFHMPKPLHSTPELLTQFERKREIPIRFRVFTFIKSWIQKLPYDLLASPAVRSLLISFLQSKAECYPAGAQTCTALIAKLHAIEDTSPSECPSLFPSLPLEPPNQPTKPFVEISASEIAQHLLSIAFRAYQGIPIKEFLKLTGPRIDGLQLLSEQITSWFLSELVSPKTSPSHTLRTFCHIHSIFAESLSLRNAFAADAILQALETVHSVFEVCYSHLPPASDRLEKLKEQVCLLSEDRAKRFFTPSFRVLTEQLSKVLQADGPDYLSPDILNVSKMSAVGRHLDHLYTRIDQELLTSLQSSLAQVAPTSSSGESVKKLIPLKRSTVSLLMATIHNLDGVRLEGIFRISGSSSSLRQLADQLCSQQPLNLSGYDVHEVASLLKLYLRELAVPVIPLHLYDRFLSVIDHSGVIDEQLIQQAIQELPAENKSILQLLFAFLDVVTSHQSVNKMSASNLAIVFGPTLLRIEDPLAGLQDASEQSTIVQYLLENHLRFFGDASFHDLVSEASETADQSTGLVRSAELTSYLSSLSIIPAADIQGMMSEIPVPEKAAPIVQSSQSQQTPEVAKLLRGPRKAKPARVSSMIFKPLGKWGSSPGLQSMGPIPRSTPVTSRPHSATKSGLGSPLGFGVEAVNEAVEISRHITSLETQNLLLEEKLETLCSQQKEIIALLSHTLCLLALNPSV